ncbi:MAG: hypothetical protein R3C11_20420 [Planctomycetaceae bacterium]
MFNSAIKNYELALSRDPHNPRRFIDLGNLWQEAFLQTRSPAVGEKAGFFYSDGVSRYPADAYLRAQYALLLQEIGDIPQAISEANRALQLDEANNLAGHTDQRLDEGVQETLKHLIEEGLK